MKILYRVLIREFLQNYFLAQLLLIFVLILNRIFELTNLIIGKGVEIGLVIQLFLYTLPFLIFLTIPMSVLVSIIITFGRMGNDFEIIAIRSAGIDLIHLIKVLMLFSILLFIIAFVFTDYIVPDSNHKVKIILSNIATRRPAVNIEESTVKKSYDKNLKFFFEKIDKKNNFSNSRIFKDNSIISAPNGKIFNSSEFGKNIVLMTNGKIFEENKEDNRENIIYFDTMYIKISLVDKKDLKENMSRSDREMSIGMLINAINKIKLKKSDNKMNKEWYKKKIYRYMVEIHKKFSISFGVFAFILLGSMIGINIRKSGLGVGFLISTILFVIYYIILVVGEQFSDRGIIHPAITMWSANIITIIVSIFLLHHTLYEMPYKWTEKLLNKIMRKSND